MLDIPGIEYFKKNTWCGSHKNKRCRISVAEDKFVVTVWNGPFCFEATAEDNKTNYEFEFSKNGLQEVNVFLNNELS